MPIFCEEDKGEDKILKPSFILDKISSFLSTDIYVNWTLRKCYINSSYRYESIFSLKKQDVSEKVNFYSECSTNTGSHLLFNDHSQYRIFVPRHVQDEMRVESATEIQESTRKVLSCRGYAPRCSKWNPSLAGEHDIDRLLANTLASIFDQWAITSWCSLTTLNGTPQDYSGDAN